MQGNPSPTPSPCHICPAQPTIKNQDNKPQICTLKSTVEGQEEASFFHTHRNTSSYFPTSFFEVRTLTINQEPLVA